MKNNELDPQSLSALVGVIPENKPIVMLNLLRYKEQADYGDRTEFVPCSGREAYYQRYVSAFARVAATSVNANSFKLVFLGSVLASLVGSPEESWDDVVLVEYTDFAVFRAIVESPDYERDADPHRRAALEDWRLIGMLKQPLG